MALASYKDLCLDAVDPAALGRFWAGALHLDLEPLDDGDVRLVGPTPQHTVWVNAVPEPRTVKQRVHLDVRAAGVADLVALGGTVVDGTTHAWTVMTDVEGGELCAFGLGDDGRPGMMEVVVDCADPASLAAWWGDVLGATGQDDPQGFSYVEDVPGAPFRWLTFVPVPEPKTAKNRTHLDLTAPAVQPLLDAGARLLAPPSAEARWSVLADPEGNEFCVFTP